MLPPTWDSPRTFKPDMAATTTSTALLPTPHVYNFLNGLVRKITKEAFSASNNIFPLVNQLLTFLHPV